MVIGYFISLVSRMLTDAEAVWIKEEPVDYDEVDSPQQNSGK